MSDNIIVAKKLTKTYGTKKKVDVLKQVDIKIKRGSFNWIIGSSGSGKTTLLNLISGIDEASSGKVYINDKLITQMNDKERARYRANHLGFVFQFHYLLPEFTALDNILMPLKIQKKKVNKKVKKDALELMKQFKIEHVYKNYPHEMSGGEQQRTAIARAIIGKPALLIADEPTGNLDSENAIGVYNLIREIHKNTNTTFLVVTHDNFTPYKGDRVITLSDGKILKDEIIK